LVEIKSNLYRSYYRNIYFDVIWKSEIPRKKFDNDLKVRETITKEQGMDYYFSLSNVVFSGTLSSSLIFAFQNGKGLEMDDFEEDLRKIETAIANDFNEYAQKQTFAKPANVCKINLNLKNDSQDIPSQSKSEDRFDIKVNHEHIEIDNGINPENINTPINNSYTKDSNENMDLNENENLKENGNKNENEETPSNENASNVQSPSYSDSQLDSNSHSINSNNDQSGLLSDSVTSNESHSDTSNNSKVSSNGSSYSNNYYNSNCSSQATVNQEINYTCKISDSILNNNTNSLNGKYHIENKSNYCNEEKSTEGNDEKTYDISLVITIVNFTTLNLNFKNVKKGEIIFKEIPLNSFFYYKILPKDDPIIVVEVTIKKNHNLDTEFTGIVNQAMTCYMNSMLQTLNILGFFKNALFQVPVDYSEVQSNSVVYSLQRLFYDLLTEDDPISTERLTKSFGWSDDQIFIQHDVQEFNLLLCDIMENRMKGTKAEGTFKYLFEGKILNCIDCVDVDYHSKKEESFYDLQLTIKGCNTIYESFNKYTEEEIMDGEDKYHTDEHGKQKAKKFLKFLNFPPVLILQLKRFEYNPRKDSMDKINDFFQFYDEINLSPYKARNINQDNEAMENSREESYSLHSIVVHKGNINNGHYFAYIKPYIDGGWYLFNDEIVREADYDEVFTCNFGGPSSIFKHKDRGIINRLNRFEGNAYILVYIKNSMRNSILKKLTVLDIPLQTRELIEREKALEKKRREEIIRKTRNMDIFLLSKEDILNYHGLGITPSILEVEQHQKLYDLHSNHFNLPKDLKIKDFRRFISQCTGIPEQYLLIYNFCLIDPSKISRRNKFKMNHLNEEIIENKTMHDLKDLFYDFKFCWKTVYFYIDCKFPDNVAPYKILARNENPQDGEIEFPLNDELKSVIYINNHNKMIFNFNVDLIERYTSNLNMQQDEINSKLNRIDFKNIEMPKESHASYKLIFFKLADLSNHSIVIDDVVNILYNETVDQALETFKEKYKYILQRQLSSCYYESALLQLDEIEFLLEKTSANYTKNSERKNSNEITQNENSNTGERRTIQGEGEIQNRIEKTEVGEESELLVKIEKFSEVFLQNNDNDAFVLIPFLKRKNQTEQAESNTHDRQIMDNIPINESEIPIISTFQIINKIWDRSFNLIYLELILRRDDGIEFQIKKEKFPFMISEPYESIKRRIYNYISESNFAVVKEILSENFEIFIFDEKKQLLRQLDFIETFTLENIIVRSFKITQNLITEVNRYPLLKYIGVSRQTSFHRLDFNIQFLKPELYSDYELLPLMMFDIDNNPFAKLNIFLPNELRICEEIVNYLYNQALLSFKQFYNIPPKNFYFIIQNDKASFAYDLFANRSINLFQHKNAGVLIRYRLQPLRDQEIENINEKENCKIFCAFSTKEQNVACNPIVFFSKVTSTVKEIKMFLLEKMNKIEQLAILYGEITLEKVKFYTYSLIDYNPVKDILLLRSKDDEPIQSYFKKGGANNLLIEFLVPDMKSVKVEGNSNGNGFLNDSLSLK